MNDLSWGQMCSSPFRIAGGTREIKVVIRRLGKGNTLTRSILGPNKNNLVIISLFEIEQLQGENVPMSALAALAASDQ